MPTITGTAQVGQTLTAVTTGITDANGLTSPTYTYQWIRVNGSEADISGANSSTYTLVDADLGKTITVRVTFDDDAGNTETLTSAATAPTLSALSLGTGVTLTPTFAAGTTAYRAWVANSVSSVTVTATTTDDSAKVAIADDTDTSTPNTATLNLSPGANKVIVEVTAEDESTTETYTVTVVARPPRRRSTPTRSGPPT